MTARLLIAEVISTVEGIRTVTVAGTIAEVMVEGEIVEVVTEMSFTAPSASAVSSLVEVLALTRRSTPFASLSGRCAIKPRSAG